MNQSKKIPWLMGYLSSIAQKIHSSGRKPQEDGLLFDRPAQAFLAVNSFGTNKLGFVHSILLRTKNMRATNRALFPALEEVSEV